MVLNAVKMRKRNQVCLAPCKTSPRCNSLLNFDMFMHHLVKQKRRLNKINVFYISVYSVTPYKAEKNHLNYA